MTQTSYNTYVQRVHRQHNSLVVVVPYLLAKRQQIKAGDHLIFTGDEDSKFIKLEKLKQMGVSDGRNKRIASKQYRDRRSRIKARGRR